MSVLKIFTWIYTGFLFQFMLCLFFFVGLQGLSSRGQQNNSEHRSWGELKVLLLDCLYSDFSFLHPSPVLCLPDPRQLSSWSSRGSETDAVQTAGCGGQASASRRRITKFSKEAWEVGDRGDASESGLRVKKKKRRPWRHHHRCFKHMTNVSGLWHWACVSVDWWRSRPGQFEWWTVITEVRTTN